MSTHVEIERLLNLATSESDFEERLENIGLRCYKRGRNISVQPIDGGAPKRLSTMGLHEIYVKKFNVRFDNVTRAKRIDKSNNTNKHNSKSISNLNTIESGNQVMQMDGYELYIQENSINPNYFAVGYKGKRLQIFRGSKNDIENKNRSLKFGIDYYYIKKNSLEDAVRALKQLKHIFSDNDHEHIRNRIRAIRDESIINDVFLDKVFNTNTKYWNDIKERIE